MPVLLTCFYQHMRKQKTEQWNIFPFWWCCWGLLYQSLGACCTFCLLWQQQHSIKNCCLSQAWSSILWHSSGILHCDVLKANKENFEQIPCHNESGGKRWSYQNCCSKPAYTPHAALTEGIWHIEPVEEAGLGMDEQRCSFLRKEW